MIVRISRRASTALDDGLDERSTSSTTRPSRPSTRATRRLPAIFDEMFALVRADGQALADDDLARVRRDPPAARPHLHGGREEFTGEGIIHRAEAPLATTRGLTLRPSLSVPHSDAG